MRSSIQAGSRAARRGGFTLVELLVAAALSMFIMSILAAAFSKGLDTFRHLRSVGNMQEQLRMAGNVLKRDLSSPHFGGVFTPGLGGAYLNQQRPDLSTTTNPWSPPTQGYFYLSTPSGSTSEGNDVDGIPSTRSGGPSTLAMTVLLPGLTPQQQFYASAPNLPASFQNPDYQSGTIAASPNAEVVYFLSASGQSTPTANGLNGVALYTLYRQQRIIFATATGDSSDLEVSPYSLSDVASTPSKRIYNNGPTPYTGANQGDDILMTNVLSFEIKPTWTLGPNSGNSAAPNTMPANYDYPFDTIPTGTYDTATGQPAVRITGIQIKLRIWDSKAQQARQITVLQDL